MRSAQLLITAEKIDRAKQRWVWVFALLCAAALGISGLREYHVIAELQSQNQHIQTLVSSTTERLVKLTDAQKTTKTEADALKAAQLLLMSNRGRSVQILEVSKSIPLDSWVSEFELNGSTLHLGGFLKSGVNTVLTNLQNQPSIKSATLLGALSSTVRDKSRRFQFEVTFSGDPL